MRLVSFRRDSQAPRAGIMTDDGIIDIHEALALVDADRPAAPVPLSAMLSGTHDVAHLGAVAVIEDVVAQLQAGGDVAYWFGGVELLVRRNDVLLLPPLPDVSAWWRCGLALDVYQALLVERGEHLPLAWYDHPPIWPAYAPVRWGDRALVPFPDTPRCDIECEIGWVTQRALTNADAADAADAVFGYCLVATIVDAVRAADDVLHGPWSRPVGVIMGPGFTSGDELTEFVLPDGRLRIDLRLLVNDEPVATYHLRDLHWGVGEALAQLSDGQSIAAGTLFTSGVLCRIAGSAAPWLVPGDAVAIDAGPLGMLCWTMEG